MRKLILIIFLVVGWFVSGQSVTGTSGLIHIPSARMLEDGQLVIGAAFIPKPYFQRYEKRLNPGLNTYVTYALLPFMEVMFRYTHELNVPVKMETGYFPDRMLGFRARLLKEKKYLPALVFGIHDFSKLTKVTSQSNLNSMYSSSYLVVSKKLKPKQFKIDISIGYAFDLMDLESKDFKGLFYGFEIIKHDFNYISLIFEHNSKGINTGFKLNLISKFNFILGMWNLDKPTFAFNYLF